MKNKSLLEKILPEKITNNYTGSKIALYVFALITILTIGRSLIHILALDGGAQSIAGFPLDSYSTDASKVIILVFSLWGLAQLLMGIVYVIVLLKYKSLISLMYVLIFLEYLGRFLLGFYKPAASLHIVPGNIADYIMIPLALIMLLLSLKSNE